MTLLCGAASLSDATAVGGGKRMEATVRHALSYDVERSVQIDDLIKSLEANAFFIRSALRVLERVYPGLSIEDVRISVVSVSQSSPLKEILSAAIVVSYQKQLEEEVSNIILSSTGYQLPESIDSLVTVFVMIIAIYGISKCFDLIFPGRDRGPLKDTQHELASKASELTGKKRDEIEREMERELSGKTKAATLANSQKFFAPTRGQFNTSIEAGPQVTIPWAAIRLAQAAAGLPLDADDRQRVETQILTSVDVVLHAMDLDRRSKGWAGHIPSVSDQRMPMKIDQSIEQESLFGRVSVVGDVLLALEFAPDGTWRPKDFTLLRIVG
ncbi:conserved hypothetical protein [Hyphomicrobiales bacterium]|nr:conserved hypothetical protein [Hyphomicrobiales bacterium]CAH1663870.1 conserved hypothetical protein [Hyphomicrobiales bacterium]